MKSRKIKFHYFLNLFYFFVSSTITFSFRLLLVKKLILCETQIFRYHLKNLIVIHNHRLCISLLINKIKYIRKYWTKWIIRLFKLYSKLIIKIKSKLFKCFELIHINILVFCHFKISIVCPRQSILNKVVADTQ